MSLAGSLANANTRVGNDTSKLFNNGDKKPVQLGGMVDSVSGIQKNVAGAVVGGGNIVAKVAGSFGGKLGGKLADALTGKVETKYVAKKETGSLGGLRSFYDQFSGVSLNSIDRIDPFSTFECTFQFFPNITAVQDVTKINKVTQKMVTTTKSVWTGEETDQGELVYEKQTSTQGSVTKGSSEEKSDVRFNTVIGRLLQQVMFRNLEQSMSYADEKKETVNNRTVGDVKPSDDGQTTTQVNTAVNTKYFTRNYSLNEVNLGIYIQKVILPQMQVEGGEDVTTLVGKFPVPGNLAIPDNNTIQMEIVNVESPVQENIFYPWMRETTLPWWSYDDQPFTTATISFDFTEHSQTIYHFFGCRPTTIQLMQPDQAPSQNMTRLVTFTFDFMTIESLGNKATDRKSTSATLASGRKTGESKTGFANAALFSATNTLKL